MTLFPEDFKIERNLLRTRAVSYLRCTVAYLRAFLRRKKKGLEAMSFLQVSKILTTFAISVSSLSAFAGGWSPYEEAAFAKAQGEGKTIVLDFHADWCPTCKKQKPILESLLQEEQFGPVVGLTVDFDKENQLKKQLKVQKQSTIIVFKGKNEVARSTGITKKDEIKALVSKGI
jgi:thioredoxin 1